MHQIIHLWISSFIHGGVINYCQAGFRHWESWVNKIDQMSTFLELTWKAGLPTCELQPREGKYDGATCPSMDRCPGHSGGSKVPRLVGLTPFIQTHTSNQTYMKRC